MTIHRLHSTVIQEAYHGRYKNAVHIRAFEKAVKRYRERIQNAKTLSGRRGRRLNFQGRSNRTAAPADLSQDLARSTPRVSAEYPMANAFESNTRAQGSLEALPDLVLRYAKIFHTYIRLFVDDTKVLEVQNGNIATVNSGMDEVSHTLRNLLDEIAALGGIGKAMKEEISQDPDARHVSEQRPFTLILIVSSSS
jgi:potassium channel subfamily K, other eukaryote